MLCYNIGGELSCGDCDHSCAIFDQQLECVCDTGFKLSSDGHSCFPAEGTVLIPVLAANTQIYMWKDVGGYAALILQLSI